jgi:hypothetical protein
VALALAAAAAVACLLAGLRQIVARPRLSVDGRLRVVDEALRADGAHRLAAPPSPWPVRARSSA